MAFYHDFLYGDTIETPALPTKSRAQPPRACNNRPVIYYNNADKTFYDKPQQEKRRTTIKQSMFGHITHKIFNKPLQKKTEQHGQVKCQGRASAEQVTETGCSSDRQDCLWSAAVKMA